MKEVKKFRFIPILLAVILAVFLLLSSVTTIPAGHTGVVTTFGKVSGTVLGEGGVTISPAGLITPAIATPAKPKAPTAAATLNAKAFLFISTPIE